MIPLFAAILAAPKPSPSTALNAIARSIGVCVAVPVGTSRMNGAGRKLIERRKHRRIYRCRITRTIAVMRRRESKCPQIDGCCANATMRDLPCPSQRGQRTSRTATRVAASGSRGLRSKLCDGYRPKIRKAANPHAATPTSNIAQSEGLSSQRRPSLVSCAITPDTRHSRISAIQVKAASNSP